MTIFIRLIDASLGQKAVELLEVVGRIHRAEDTTVHGRVFERAMATFSAVPGSPFSYWASPRLMGVFRALPALSCHSVITVGLQSSDDYRFLRTWWESPPVGFVPFAKGGSYSCHYCDVGLAIKCYDDLREVKAFAETTPGSMHWSRNIRSAEHYLRPGLTWPLRTNGLSFRAMPAGCVFGHKGPAAFVEGDSQAALLALSAMLSSSAFGYLVRLQTARTELAQSFEVGLIQQTPVPTISDGDTSALARLAGRAWSLKRTLDTTNETSHAFVLPPGTIGYEAVAPHEQAGGFSRIAIEHELVALQRQIDEKAFALYGIGPEDRGVIESASNRADGSATDIVEDGGTDEGDSSEAPIGVPVLPVYSWLVGVAFGRFDKRLATGERAIPPEPKPFDPLPARSPGMWPEGEARAVIPPRILVNDSGHEDDISAHVAEAAAGTGWRSPDDLRPWLAREFFPLHLKMYSKSRRKAPIYWQLATPSASYSVWLYLHAFTKDTLFQVQNDYAAPKLAHEERKLDALRSESGQAKAADRKALAAQESFVEELRAFLEEVKRVAPLWNPDLDDGVIINFAPLWRLVPQHKPWQKELKSTWDSLCAGDYDWAHLTMHLWPERVVPKCAKDRSLAIAHGLEDVFWVEGANGKWKPRPAPTRPVDELVAERSSPAVKAALANLLEAPVAAGTIKRKGKRRA